MTANLPKELQDELTSQCAAVGAFLARTKDRLDSLESRLEEAGILTEGNRKLTLENYYGVSDDVRQLGSYVGDLAKTIQTYESTVRAFQLVVQLMEREASK